MAKKVRLYGANLFTRYKFRGKRPSSLGNNAPGGEGGVDSDVQERLGAPGLDTIGLTMVDRKHGICCGITIAWMIGFCHSVEGARRTSKFEGYYRDVLRFQGAYLKDNKGNINSIDDFANTGFAHGCKAVPPGSSSSAKVSLKSFGLGSLPTPSKPYAMYLGIWGHAIGAGVSSDRHFIMEPNAGLFSYSSGSDMEADMNDLVEARRVSKGKSGNDKFNVWVYKKA